MKRVQRFLYAVVLGTLGACVFYGLDAVTYALIAAMLLDRVVLSA